MKDQFLQYIFDQFNGIPASVSWVLLIVFCLGTILLLVFLGYKNGMKWSARIFLLEYLFLLCLLTVFSRSVQTERIYELTPFWSYRDALEADSLPIQLVLNILVFIPVGVLLKYAFSKKWWKAALICGGFSVIIELLQFVLKRGVAEFDDVFHNVVGCLIGYGLYVAIAYLVKKMYKKADA